MPAYTTYLPVMVNTGSSRYRPGTASSSSRSSGSSSGGDSDKGKLTEKDLFSMLEKVEGLPNDMADIYSSILRMYKLSNVVGGIDTSLLASQYIRTLQKIKTAKFYGEEYQKAHDDVAKKQALNEIAITNGGLVFVLDKETNESKLVTVLEFGKNKDKYTALTNEQIFHQRYSRANQIYDSTYLDIVDNAISKPVVNEMIHDCIRNLGSSEVTKNTFQSHKNDAVIKGLLELEGISNQVQEGDSYLELLNLIKTKGSSKLIAAALTYIYEMLPKNARDFLIAKSDGTEKGAKSLILLWLISSASDAIVVSEKEKHATDENKKGKSGKSGSGSNNVIENYNNGLFLNITRLEGGSYGTYSLKDKDGYAFSVNGVHYPSLSVNPDKPIPSECTLLDLLTEHGLAGIKDGGKAITFGDKILDPQLDFKNIVFTNSTNSICVILPIKRLSNGTVVPDLEIASRNKDLLNELANSTINKTLLSEESKQKLKELNFIDPYTGEVNMDRLLPYLLLDGLATSENIDKTTHYVKETTDDRLISTFKNGVGSSFDYDTNGGWFNPFDYGGRYTHLYEGTIFIPVTQNLLLAITAEGTLIKQGDSLETERTYLQGMLRSLMNTTSSEVLGL